MDGAFDGLEDTIKDRLHKKTIGFGADIKSKNEIEKGQLLKEVQPEDLVRFGLIPEFVGRLPIYSVLEPLTKDMLKKILIEPKNALVKQFKKLLNLDNVDLQFEDDALDAIVDKAIKRETGARGLRSIIEEIMRDIMFEIPNNEAIRKCIITKDTVVNNKEPILIYEAKEEVQEENKNKKAK